MRDLDTDVALIKKMLEEGYDCISSERVCGADEQDDLDMWHRETLAALDRIVKGHSAAGENDD